MARYTFVFEPKPLDKTLFRNLLDILVVGCLRGNIKRSARILGVTTVTMTKWYRKNHYPPESQHYWNKLLELTIKETITIMRASSNTATSVRQANKVSRDLHQIQPQPNFEYMEVNNPPGASDHLLSLFRSQPMHTTEYIFKTANNGGYSKEVLRHARRQLNLDHWSEGFGENKHTYWGLQGTKDQTND